MKTHKLILAAFFWLAATFSLQAGTAVQIKAGALNVRSAPSSTKLGLVYSGQKYSYEGKSGSWFKIRYDNRIGYVYGGSYASTTSARLATVTASALNVRTGPGGNYTRVGTVYKNQRFVLTGSTNGSWVQIFFGGNKRWTHGSYLSQEGATPTPAPQPTGSPINITYFALGTSNNATTSTRYITARFGFKSNGAVVRDYRMSESSSFSGAGWKTYTTRPNFTLSSGNGTKRVYIQFRDTRFRVSNSRSDTIVLSVPTSTPPGLARSFDRAKWFNNYRAIYGNLSQSKVSGINFLLANMEKDSRPDSNAATARRQLSYIMATTKHEVADTYQPITEYGSVYCPGYDGGCRYKGRGYVQLTHRSNYRNMSRIVGVDLEANPERALEPNIAYTVMSYGMFNGSFTGAKLGTYITRNSTDYFNARRIVNGDRNNPSYNPNISIGNLIKGYAVNFETIFNASVN